MNKIFYGFHYANSLLFNIKEKIPLQINTIQVFLCSPQKYLQYKEYKYGIDLNPHIKEKQINVFVHFQYVFNLANEELNNKQIPQLYLNIKQSLQINKQFGQKLIKGVVFHVGNNQKENKGRENLQFVIETLLQQIKEELINDIELVPLLILETPAKEKNEILYDLKDFLNFIQNIQNKSIFNRQFLSMCFDTCHLYQAKNLQYFDQNLENIMQNLQNKNVLIHLNDSKYDNKQEYGRDFHDIIGANIGKQFFVQFLDRIKKIQEQNINIYIVQEKQYNYDFYNEYVNK